MTMTERLAQAVADVAIERRRQEDLKRQGRFAYTLADDGMTDFQRLACIAEEIGEVSRCLLGRAGLTTDGGTDAMLRAELCQVAALAVAWMERL